MKKTPIKKISSKTKARNLLWKEITCKRIQYLRNKYHRTLCEYCGDFGVPFSKAVNGLWGHHIDGNRNTCTPENCYIVHNAPCHDEIQYKITVKQEGFEGIKEVNDGRI